MLACFRSLALVKIHGLGSVDHVGIQATPKCCDAVLEADGGLMEMGKGAGSWPIETMWGTHGNPISAGRLLLELMHPQAPTSSEKQRKDLSLESSCSRFAGMFRATGADFMVKSLLP